MVNKKEILESGLNLDNTYNNLPKLFFSEVNLNTVPSPKIVIFNNSLAKSLGLNSNNLKSKEGVSLLAGNKRIKEGIFIAQAYAGHQFGNFAILGDGRTILLGEQITPLGERFDIQLKGSGKTPYSRGGDGKAALGPMLREYIISEGMYGLGIPTTRSLAVIKTGEFVFRQSREEGAILTRVASSHIRFGTFEYAYHRGTYEELEKLANYCLKRHFPHIKDNNDKYLNLLNEVIKVQASLVAKWQAVGFIHGVMNTDNMTISGETIDYGPCAFMDNYNPDTVFSSIDIQGRYAYKNQPIMTEWNLCRFAETLIPLLDKNKERAINIAQDAVSNFYDLYYSNWISNMRFKIGIFNQEEQDKVIIEDLLSIIEKYNEDYTNTFISLTFNNYEDKDIFKSKEFSNWYKVWKERLKRQPQSKETVAKLMKESNPAVIPRNHRVEDAIEAANKGDYNVMKKFLDVLSRPYDHSKDQEEYSKPPKVSDNNYRTFCGT
jgi:uncharacterized protein YdiU (UPF0061 family)